MLCVILINPNIEHKEQLTLPMGLSTTLATIAATSNGQAEYSQRYHQMEKAARKYDSGNADDFQRRVIKSMFSSLFMNKNLV